MRAFDRHEAWEMKPRKLTIEEVENPKLVIEELFRYATLPELRWCLTEGTQTLVTGTYHTLKAKERQSMLYFYEHVEKLIEVTHVIFEKWKTPDREPITH